MQVMSVFFYVAASLVCVSVKGRKPLIGLIVKISFAQNINKHGVGLEQQNLFIKIMQWFWAKVYVNLVAQFMVLPVFMVHLYVYLLPGTSQCAKCA